MSRKVDQDALPHQQESSPTCMLLITGRGAGQSPPIVPWRASGTSSATPTFGVNWRVLRTEALLPRHLPGVGGLSSWVIMGEGIQATALASSPCSGPYLPFPLALSTVVLKVMKMIRSYQPELRGPTKSRWRREQGGCKKQPVYLPGPPCWRSSEWIWVYRPLPHHPPCLPH